ncbi:MAG: hypothetical protein QM726_11930 [Chitinophagaceae bacterium]
MNYVEVKSRKDNFGDDLNVWLWPQIFNKEMPNANDIFFLGIGTILAGGSKELQKMDGYKKVVFGSGVRPSESYKIYKPDALTDIVFLRGPLSSQFLNNQYDYITDAAYAIRQLPDFEKIKNTEKKYDVSLMPYFLSTDYFNWEKICEELGFHYISPLSEKGVDFTLSEIAASKYLISEAMHGAIAADILRVPWHRFVLTTPHTEGAMVSEFKWADWLQSVQLNNLEVSFIPFYMKSRVHLWVKALTGNIVSTEFLYKPFVKKKIIETLSQVKNYHLSKDNVITKVDDMILSKINQVMENY